MQFVAADDFGNIINPMIVEGQVHGGIAQGVGQALLEGCRYDAESGQLITASYNDYTMPRAGDLPSFVVSTTVTPCPSNPLGVKGCGEAGAIGSPPAVINAHHRCARRQQPDHAGHAGEGLAARAEGDHAPGGGIGERTMYRDHLSPAEEPGGSGEALLQLRRTPAYISGGHTLLPTMKARLAAPKNLIDLRQVPGAEGHPGVGRRA